MSEIPYTRYIDFSDEARALIKKIWGDDKPSAPYVIVRQAMNKGVTVEEYLKGRLANPYMENGRMPKKFREPLVARMTSMGPRKHTDEAKVKLREKHTGKEIPPEHRENMRAPQIGKKMSPEAIAKTVAANLGSKRTLETRRNISAAQKKGKDNPNWKGTTTENQVIRHSSENRIWREAVFERDNYTCLKTGIKGNKLNAHHLWPFANNEDLRFAVFNGVTLSEDAHRDFHRKYGTKNTTVWQFEEWLGRELPRRIRAEVEIQDGWDMYEIMQGYSEYEDD